MTTQEPAGKETAPTAALLQAPEFSAADPRMTAAERATFIADFKVEDKKKHWNQAKHTAETQADLAKALILIVAGVLLVGAGLLVSTKWTGLQTRDVLEFFGVAFAAVVTLATAATSFWFGSRTHERLPADDGSD